MNIITHIQFGNDFMGHYSHETLVTELHTRFGRQFNAFHPSSQPDCLSLDVSLVAPGKDNLFFYEWYINNRVVSGRIKYQLMDLTSKGENISERYIYFNDAQCYYIGERYDINDKSLRILDLKLRTTRCTIDDVEYGQDNNAI